jgi:putative NADPH-quinone reductase
LSRDVNDRFDAIRPYLTGELNWANATVQEIALGYEAQAADVRAEQEALEWCEALIGDAWIEDDVYGKTGPG